MNFNVEPLWKHSTDGELLFFSIFKLVKNASISSQCTNASWLFGEDHLIDFFNLSTTMVWTHRCLNESISIVKTNPNCNVASTVLRLNSRTGISAPQSATTVIAELSLRSAKNYLFDKLTNSRKEEIYKSSPTLNCCWCGASTTRNMKAPTHEKSSIEHIWPLYLGGSSTIDNLTIACKSCNTSRQHGYNWAWYPVHSFTHEFKSETNQIPKNIMLALGLFRLMQDASNGRKTLKDSILSLKNANPPLVLTNGNRYTFFDLLKLLT